MIAYFEKFLEVLSQKQFDERADYSICRYEGSISELGGILFSLGRLNNFC